MELMKNETTCTSGVNITMKPAILMKILFFAESLAEICKSSCVAPGRPLRWIIIANPSAGGFGLRSRWKMHRPALANAATEAAAATFAKTGTTRENCVPMKTAEGFGNLPALSALGLVPTNRPGAGREIARTLVDEAANSLGENADAAPLQAVPFYLVVVAGGDGSSLEVLSVLQSAPETVRSNMAVLRLPMGTGNDGADAPQLAAALELLTKPSRVELTPALRLTSAPTGKLAERGPFPAFNVLSMGLDAFVTHMTNKMKKKSPGDFYKLWVDIAALMYDRLYTVGFLDVKAVDSHGMEVKSFREKLLLIAVGASGHRTYGSQKKILPDERNVCAIKQMSLFHKLAIKGFFATGGHTESPEAILFNARKLEISGTYPILAQADGEAVLLEKDDFPATIELTEPVIPVLRLL